VCLCASVYFCVSFLFVCTGVCVYVRICARVIAWMSFPRNTHIHLCTQTHRRAYAYKYTYKYICTRRRYTNAHAHAHAHARCVTPPPTSKLFTLTKYLQGWIGGKCDQKDPYKLVLFNDTLLQSDCAPPRVHLSGHGVVGAGGWVVMVAVLWNLYWINTENHNLLENSLPIVFNSYTLFLSQKNTFISFFVFATPHQWNLRHTHKWHWVLPMHATLTTEKNLKTQVWWNQNKLWTD